MSDQSFAVEGFDSPGAAPCLAAPPQEVEFLSRLAATATEFVALPVDADIYGHIATRLRELVGDCWVVAASFDEATRELRQRGISGSSAFYEVASKLLGHRVVGYRNILNEEAAAQISVGHLGRLDEGLYEAMLRAIPRTVARAAERLGSITGVHGMGCVAHGTCIGSILIFLRNHQPLPPVEVVEAFINQAAMALQKRCAEDSMRDSEARYRTLVRGAWGLYLVTTTEGVILEVNPATVAVTGRSEEDLIGLHLSELLGEAALAVRPLRFDRMKSGLPFSATRWVERPDGTRALVEAHVTPLLDDRLLIMGRDMTERHRLERDVLDAGLRERRAMGRDLHDSLAQLLAGTHISAAVLRRNLENEGRVEAAAAARIEHLIGDSMSETRRILNGLCPVDVEEGNLGVALQQLAAITRVTYDIDCREDIDDAAAVRVSDAMAGHVCLVAREAVSNAARHSSCKTITLGLHVLDGHGILCVRDDGKGLGTDSKPRGMGLKTMRYRAEAIDGNLEITACDPGTAVTCTFPLEQPGLSPSGESPA
jgi:PAS domain S-box-containing protein